MMKLAHYRNAYKSFFFYADGQFSVADFLLCVVGSLAAGMESAAVQNIGTAPMSRKIIVKTNMAMMCT